MADIILSNICKRFGEKSLFENFSLKIERGNFFPLWERKRCWKNNSAEYDGLA